MDRLSLSLRGCAFRKSLSRRRKNLVGEGGTTTARASIRAPAHRSTHRQLTKISRRSQAYEKPRSSGLTQRCAATYKPELGGRPAVVASLLPAKPLQVISALMWMGGRAV